MKLVILMVLTATSQAIFTAENSKTWSRTYVPGADMATMISNNAGISYNFQSKFLCAAKAQENFKFLMCIHQNQCIISTYQLEAMDSDAGVTDPVTCWTIWPVYCKSDQGAQLLVGRSFACEASCEHGENITAYGPHVPDRCSNPYTIVTDMCLLYETTKKTYCDAKKHCLSMGSDLATVTSANVYYFRMGANYKVTNHLTKQFWINEFTGSDGQTYSDVQQSVPKDAVPPIQCALQMDSDSFGTDDCTSLHEYACNRIRN